MSNNSATADITVKSADLSLQYDAVYQYHDDRYFTDTVVQNQFRQEDRNQMILQQIWAQGHTSEAFEPAGTARLTVRSGDHILRDYTLTDVAYDANGHYFKGSSTGDGIYLVRASNGLTFVQYEHIFSSQTTSNTWCRGGAAGEATHIPPFMAPADK